MSSPSASRMAARSSTWTATSSRRRIGQRGSRRSRDGRRRGPCRSPVAARSRARPSSWRRRRQRAVEEQDVDRARRRSVRYARRTPPGRSMRGRRGRGRFGIEASREGRPAGACRSRVRGRASSRMNATGHLEPRRAVRGRTRSARRRPGPVAVGRRTIAATGTWPNVASRRATTAASAMAGWSRRTASTSAGEMFSPPRTIRSVRRSSDGQPAVVVETAEVTGPQPAVVGQGGGRRGRVVEVAVEQGRRCGPRSRRRRPRPGSAIRSSTPGSARPALSGMACAPRRSGAP